MKPRILITRPEPGASRTAERLRQLGFDAAVLPLTRIGRLGFDIPSGPLDGIVITSAHALGGTDFSRLLDLPVIAVGETTAHAAHAAGFRAVCVATGTAESVAAMATAKLKRDSNLLYLCGRVRRPELEQLLSQAGFQVSSVETYNAAPVNYSQTELANVLQGRPFDCVILMSAVATELFGKLATRLELRGVDLVCFSERIAQSALVLGRPTAITGKATEDALVDLLLGRFPARS